MARRTENLQVFNHVVRTISVDVVDFKNIINKIPTTICALRWIMGKRSLSIIVCAIA